MKNSIIASIAFTVLLVAQGCSSVKFCSGPELSVNSGLRYYSVKPFLLVERDVENNRINKSTVFYLPDLANPQYLVIPKGIGSKKVDLKLADGAISSFGLTAETGVKESIDALAGLISKSADALSDLKTLKGGSLGAATPVSIELYEIFMNSDGTSLKKVKFPD